MATFDVLHARDDARQRSVPALHGLDEDAVDANIERGQELLDLPDSVHARPKFADVIASHLASEEFGRNGELIDPHRWESIKAGSLYDVGCYQRTRPNGITLEIRTDALPDGGIVRTFTDITESKRSADEIAHMAHHDALTDLANRVLLRADIKSALERQNRNGETFA